MTRSKRPAETPMQPPLSDLLGRYLQQQVASHATGLRHADHTGEVVPFDAAPVQPVDPRVAWDGAVAVLGCIEPELKISAWQPPSDWTTLATAQDSNASVAFCIGNFPQIVRTVQPLLAASRLSDLRPRSQARPIPSLDLTDWGPERVKSKPPNVRLLAFAILRMARQFEQADQLVQTLEDDMPAGWRRVWANEKAALAWHRGNADEALALWQTQKPSSPILFNRGMANLFLDKPAEARTLLSEAAANLPEDGAWHHLARLYSALAEMRS